MVLVDSSVWIEAARRQGDIQCKIALESLLKEYEAAVCSPVKLEVLGGARKEDRKVLAAGFAIIPYIPITEDIWEFALVNAWKLRDAGHTVPWNDVLIASLSHRKICRVFARDHHFETMRSLLGIRLYMPGYGGKYAPDNGG